MADPLFELIDSISINILRDNIVFDNLFKDTPFQNKFRPGLRPITRSGMALDRLIKMGVDVNRAHEIVRKMVSSGTIDKPDEVIFIEHVDKFNGGIAIREPITYATVSAKEDTE